MLRRPHAGLIARLLLGLFGGALIAHFQADAGHLGRPDYAWARPMIAVTFAAVALCLAEVDKRLAASGLTGALTAAWAVVVLCCVPETGHLPPVLAVTTALATWQFLSKATIPLPCHLAIIWLVLSAGVFGSSGRPSALCGALFGVWPFVLTALARPGTMRFGVPIGRACVYAALGGLGALVVSRTGALAQAGLRAPVLAIGATISVTVVLLAVVESRQFRPAKA